LRITVGTHAENMKLVELLNKVLNKFKTI